MQFTLDRVAEIVEVSSGCEENVKKNPIFKWLTEIIQVVVEWIFTRYHGLIF